MLRGGGKLFFLRRAQVLQVPPMQEEGLTGGPFSPRGGADDRDHAG